MKKKYYVIAGLLILGAIFTPIVCFLLYFKADIISTDPAKWGQFGDFFGGTLNPIISLASLVTLGYLTYLVSTLSTQENKKLFILEMRMQAYDELAAMRVKVNVVSFDIRNASFLRVKTLPPHKQWNIVLEEAKQVLQSAKVYTELHYLLIGFEMRYGHLFNYKFKDDKFKSLTDQSRKLMNQVDPSSKTKNASPTDENSQIKVDMNLFYSELDLFISTLKKELA
jgi:hypothetical protein